MNFDLIVIGSGPGGYVAAIRASQLGLKTAIIEKEELGGVCLNWGCIPTKALLKSAQVFNYLNHASEYGFTTQAHLVDFPKVIGRSRGVAQNMSKGVQFLMKKNKIEVVLGKATLKKDKKVLVKDKEGKETLYSAKHIIVATGAKSRELPNIAQDGKKIIGYRQALSLENQPKSMVIVGSGAIGSEFAYFYNALGTKVTLIEYLPKIVPLEDEDISKELESAFKKQGITILTSSEVKKVEKEGNEVKVFVNSKGKEEIIKTEIVLCAAGISPNIENIGLEEVGIEIEKGRIKVDAFYNTNREGYYAIGDVITGPALAHVASAEGITCVEKIAGLDPEPINYNNIPACTYCLPEIASVGYTENQAKEKGHEIKVGKFPFSASGKATAGGDTQGFVKVIFDATYGEWLGCHIIGNGITDMIAEVVAARKLETTYEEILKSIHPHPTMSEAIMEAVAQAYGECIHL